MANLLNDIEAVKSALDKKIAELMPRKEDTQTLGMLLGLSFAVGAVQPALDALRRAQPATLSQWTDRDMLIGGVRYKAGSITIADVLDHAARASNEFYADDDELSEEDRHMVDRAWEKHKAAAPHLRTEPASPPTQEA